MITQETLKKFLSYNPVSGLFTWNVSSRKIKSGDIAGHKHTAGYLCVWILKEKYLLHRLAWLYMTGEFPKHQIDHIDRDKSNNKWKNLRDVTASQNKQHGSAVNHSNSGFRGVTYYPRYINKPWQAQIKKNGIAYHLGRFPTFEEAVQARINGEIKHFGH